MNSPATGAFCDWLIGQFAPVDSEGDATGQPKVLFAAISLNPNMHSMVGFLDIWWSFERKEFLSSWTEGFAAGVEIMEYSQKCTP